jgi:hypothetical protein
MRRNRKGPSIIPILPNHLPPPTTLTRPSFRRRYNPSQRNIKAQQPITKKKAFIKNQSTPQRAGIGATPPHVPPWGSIHSAGGQRPFRNVSINLMPFPFMDRCSFAGNLKEMQICGATMPMNKDRRTCEAEDGRAHEHVLMWESMAG